MTIHTTGVLALTATDFKTVHRTTEIGVKIIAWQGGMPTIALVEKKGTAYEAIDVIFEFDDVNLPEQVTAKAGGTVNWIKTVLLPLINAALKRRFPALSTTVPTTPTVAVGSLEDIDSQLGKVIGWLAKADGTLSVVAK